MTPQSVPTPQTALRYETEVQQGGRVELTVPFSPGARVAVSVIEKSDEFDDLVLASQSSLDFWDNPWDDEDWNESSNACKNCSARGVDRLSLLAIPVQ
jgi:hypothetical protein